MAYVDMFVAPHGVRNSAFEYTIELSAAGNSSWIIVPSEVKRLSVTLSVTGGGTGKVQSTTDSEDTVKNGSPIAIDWDYGTVAVNTQEVSDSCTALRLVQVSGGGTTKLTIRGST